VRERFTAVGSFRPEAVEEVFHQNDWGGAVVGNGKEKKVRRKKERGGRKNKAVFASLKGLKKKSSKWFEPSKFGGTETERLEGKRRKQKSTWGGRRKKQEREKEEMQSVRGHKTRVLHLRGT